MTKRTRKVLTEKQKLTEQVLKMLTKKGCILILLVTLAQIICGQTEQRMDQQVQKRLIDLLGVQEQNLVLAYKYEQYKRKWTAELIEKIIQKDHNKSSFMATVNSYFRLLTAIKF